MRRRIAAVLVVVAAGAGAWWMHTSAKSEADPVPVSAQVQTAPLQRAAVPTVLNVYGEVQAARLVALGFAQAGQLTEFAVQPGQFVRAGEVVATLRSDPAAQQAYAQAVSGARLAQAELHRIEEMVKLQLATASQLDVAAKQLGDAQALLAAQEKMGGAQALAQLRAPFDGVASGIAVAQGERLQAGATLFQLGRNDGFRLVLAVEPSASAALHAGMAVATEGGPAGLRLASVGRMVDPKTQMVPVTVQLDAAQGASLVAGMRVAASITLGQQDAWRMPRQAVLADEQGSYVFQVAQGKARRIAVRTLAEDGKLSAVEGKLDPKLPLVVLGNYELEDGMAVREPAR
ncbi:MAG: efflux RND transporter periplasmic adaptor subunit [Pseudomonadota bacterium]